MLNKPIGGSEPGSILLIKPEDYHFVGLDQAYEFLKNQIKLLESDDVDAKKRGRIFIFHGPPGSGKSLVINQLLKEDLQCTKVRVGIHRGDIPFGAAGRLIQTLDLTIKKKMNQFSRFPETLIEDWGTNAGLSAQDYLNRRLAGIIAKNSLQRSKIKQKTRKSLIVIEHHAKKQAEILEKLKLLSKSKPVLVIIEQLENLQMDDARVFTALHKEITGKIPVMVIYCLSEVEVEVSHQSALSYTDHIHSLMNTWTNHDNWISPNSLSVQSLEEWLKTLFPDSGITQEFVKGLHGVTSGNLREINRVFHYLFMEDMIETFGSEEVSDWVIRNKWNALISDNTQGIEHNWLARILDNCGEWLQIAPSRIRNLLEKASVVGFPFRAFEIDVLEKVLQNDERSILPYIVDFGLSQNFISPNGFHLRFDNEMIQLDFYNSLGEAARSHLHYQTAKGLEDRLLSEDFPEIRRSAYLREIAMHYVEARKCFSEKKSREARKKAFQCYILAALGMFSNGATEAALNMLELALIWLPYDPIEGFNGLSSELAILADSPQFDENLALEFLKNDFLPAYVALLAILFFPEISERSRVKLPQKMYHEIMLLLLRTYHDGILSRAKGLLKILEQVDDIPSFVEPIQTALTPLVYFLQELLIDSKAEKRKKRAHLAYKELVDLGYIAIEALESIGDPLNRANIYDLLLHYAMQVGEDPKQYYRECGDANFEAAYLPISDVVKHARIVRNAGWNYLNSSEISTKITALTISKSKIVNSKLEKDYAKLWGHVKPEYFSKTVKALRTAKSILVNSNLDHDYIHYRIAELDLRGFQMIMMTYQPLSDPLPDPMVEAFKIFFDQFWEVYKVGRKKSSYPRYLASKLTKFSEQLGNEFMSKLRCKIEPIPTKSAGPQGKSVVIVTNEFDYWLADLVCENLVNTDPRPFVRVIEPEEYHCFLEKSKPNVVILFGGPKAKFIGDIVSLIFQGEPNFRYLTWRHNDGFGGIWSKQYKNALHILIAGNDEETIDATLLFIHTYKLWESGYHKSILANYFKHL